MVAQAKRIRVVVDGARVDASRLWCAAMSLSSSRPQVAPSDFRLELQNSDFVSSLAPRYTQLTAELKQDEAATGETDRLGDAGYPDIDALLRDPSLCGWVLDAYLKAEVLCHFLPWGNTGPGSFVIDTVDTVEVAGDDVVVTGNCLQV